MENKRAHLAMIQSVVNRLAQNSFLLKGWSVVLVSALFALAANSSNRFFIYLAYFPAIAFWVLDGYFLWQERLFRALYDEVRVLNENDIEFSMDTSKLKAVNKSWSDATFSNTLKIFHGAIIGSIILVMVISIFLG
ncbi:MAG: hypothetical protein WCE58_05125 [Gallionella sp.]